MPFFKKAVQFIALIISLHAAAQHAGNDSNQNKPQYNSNIWLSQDMLNTPYFYKRVDDALNLASSNLGRDLNDQESMAIVELEIRKFANELQQQIKPSVTK